jgi:hypothetical protein
MRWVLIRPTNRSLFYDPEIQEPLGLEYIAAVLEGLGCRVLLLDSALDSCDDRRLARRAAAFQPDALGYSITTGSELESVRNINDEFSAAMGDKSAFRIAGGNYVTTEWQNAQKLLPENLHLMRYEAEISIVEIVKMWEAQSLDAFPRYIDGEPPQELDSLPFPLRPYVKYLLQYGWAFNVQASRGCCSACKYCASRGMRLNSRSAWRGRSPENIVEEVALLYDNYAARSFNFVDEDFLGPPSGAPERSRRFAQEIKRRGLSLTFGIQVRPNSLSEETIVHLVEAGLKYVFLGIESDDPADFRRWGRQYCPETWRWVESLQSKDVEVNAGTLLFHPHCTFEGMRRFASELLRHGLFNCRTATNRLHAMPGSYYYEQCLQNAPEDVPEIGVIAIPFVNETVEDFYITLQTVVEPLRAPSMHALCAMPIVRTANDKDKLSVLQAINSDCDARVSECFFKLLNMYEQNAVDEDLITEMEDANRHFGRSIADRLTQNGFVRAPENLYNSII